MHRALDLGHLIIAQNICYDLLIFRTLLGNFCPLSKHLKIQ